MKKHLFVLCLAVLITACSRDNSTEVKPMTLVLRLAYNTTGISGANLPLDQVYLKITNLGSQAVQELKVPATGILSLPHLPPGIYDIDASVTFSPEQYSALTGGIAAGRPVSFNASVRSKQIPFGFAEPIELTLVTGAVSDWVIKQIYYAGSDTRDGALYRDQFIEFYNNSDTLLYADSLCFAETTGLISRSSAASHHILPSGQLDWSKSVNMPGNIDANNDYIYARAFLMVPGNGRQYPVKPGESIVIAQTALNHKNPFTGVDGKQISVNKPELTIDLSSADFEAYYAPFARPLASDVDNLSVPNLEVISYFGNDMIFDVNGRYGYALIKAPANEKPADWPRYNLPTKAAPPSTAVKYYQIPVSAVLDAVEVQHTDVSDRMPKKYGAALDAGFAFVPLGAYTSQSVVRKKAGTAGGRIILKDTNNSSADFEPITALPRFK